jgi:dihydrofolate reductase
MTQKVHLVVAVAKNNVIGKDNDLVWTLKDDMKFFKDITTNHIILTGRRNFDSIPEKYRPLPNRLNCILTRNKDYNAQDCLVFHDIPSWIEHFKNDSRTLFVIGGGEVYKEALELDLVDVMYITHIEAEPDGDTFFPVFDRNRWNAEVIQEQEADARNELD